MKEAHYELTVLKIKFFFFWHEFAIDVFSILKFFVYTALTLFNAYNIWYTVYRNGETSADGWLHVVALKSRSSVGNVRYTNLAAACWFVCSCIIIIIIIIKKQEILAKNIT